MSLLLSLTFAVTMLAPAFVWAVAVPLQPEEHVYVFARHVTIEKQKSARFQLSKDLSKIRQRYQICGKYKLYWDLTAKETLSRWGYGSEPLDIKHCCLEHGEFLKAALNGGALEEMKELKQPLYGSKKLPAYFYYDSQKYDCKEQARSEINDYRYMVAVHYLGPVKCVFFTKEELAKKFYNAGTFGGLTRIYLKKQEGSRAPVIEKSGVDPWLKETVDQATKLWYKFF